MREMTILTTWIYCLSKVHKIFQSDDSHYASPGNDKSQYWKCSKYFYHVHYSNTEHEHYIQLLPHVHA
jgi:hypothetical protein